MYAIIDIETTGLSPVNEKITEIAIYLHDGEKIKDSFTTLINPERKISAHITQLTGITNEMVENAPKFWEVAKDIVTLTENCIFVAHNASFDYNFIRSEFKSLGYNFSRDRLCTVKLSRKIIPGFKSYSLGNLCNSLNIQVTDRHRAMGDAFATVKLFELLLQKDKTLGRKSNSKFFNIEASKIAALPEETGVYYFYNQQGDIIYIGKSKDIRSRVFSHFNNESTSKSIRMADEIFDISYELTGSELVALLLESNEIKTHKPKFNRRQRRTLNNTGIYSHIDKYGYITFKVESIRDELPLVTFNSNNEAKDRLYMLCEKYNLCQKLCGLYETSGPCFFHQIKKCNGACVQKEPVEVYNKRVEQMLEELSLAWKDFVVIDKGRCDDERSVIKVSNGSYIGFGYADIEYINHNLDNLSDVIQKYPDNKDVKQILRTYLRQHNVEKIINLK
ncbi:MAG: exonuclease domain-containing protein [Bacteroidales bacterium]|jgi:DNA polymerase-3 subunit epsilon|nr:exonuclease domain-containing protein [Bacteroidales bacterium]